MAHDATTRRELLLGSAALLVAGASRAQEQKAGEVGHTYGDLREVTLRGKLLPANETLGKMYGARLPPEAPNPYVLLLGGGEIYTLLPNETYSRLTAGPPFDEKAAEVHARHFPRSMILEPLSWKEVSVKSLRWLYYCSTCILWDYHPGPCVCCGQELERVTDPAVLDERLGPAE